VGPGEKRTTEKMEGQLQNSNKNTSQAPKIIKFLLKQDHTSKNIMQQQTLKKTSQIAHNKSYKSAVFKLSKNFMARQIHPKIE
jgi:hypothetical protein